MKFILALLLLPSFASAPLRPPELVDIEIIPIFTWREIKIKSEPVEVSGIICTDCDDQVVYVSDVKDFIIKGIYK